MSKMPDEFKMNLITVDVDLRTILGEAACDVSMCDTPLTKSEQGELVEHLQVASEIVIRGLHRKMIEQRSEDIE